MLIAILRAGPDIIHIREQSIQTPSRSEEDDRRRRSPPQHRRLILLVALRLVLERSADFSLQQSENIVAMVSALTSPASGTCWCMLAAAASGALVCPREMVR